MSGQEQVREGGHADQGFAHPVPMKILVGVAAALIVLTILTVVLSDFHFGVFDIWVAMGIAVVKGTLVALFFMHLFWDKKFNGFVFIASLFFVAIFIGFLLLDTHTYEGSVKEWVQDHPQSGHAVPGGAEHR
jgi:cytochrome c oxidase subunit 4